MPQFGWGKKVYFMKSFISKLKIIKILVTPIKCCFCVLLQAEHVSFCYRERKDMVVIKHVSHRGTFSNVNV